MGQRTRLVISFIFFGVLAIYTVRRADAAVVLASFEVEAGDSQISIEWVTGSEFELAGFLVHRNSIDDGDYSQWAVISVTDAETLVEFSPFVPARSDLGSRYPLFDPDVVEGTVYCYALEAVNSDDSREFFVPDNGTCLSPGPTPTPTNTSAATATPDATLTPSPSSSPTATNTGPVPTTTNTAPAPTITRTSAATSTPRPSRTPAPSPTETQPPTETPTITPTSTVTQTPTNTPFPTFLPTWTNTPTITPSPTQTLTPTPTQGPLLAATLSADEPGEGLFQVGEDTALTLGELILSIAGLVALVGGLLFGLIYFFILRNTNQ